MPPGKDLLALVGIKRSEAPRGEEGVDVPLGVPPFVGGIDLRDVGVIGGAEEVESSEIVGVAIGLKDAAIKTGAAI